MVRRTLFLSIFMTGLCLLFSPFQKPVLHAGSTLNKTDGTDTTVYTIGGDEINRREEKQERDKAWDMLKNMSVWPNQKPKKGQQQTQPQPPAKGDQ